MRKLVTKEPKPNRYERLMQRKDGKRPMLFEDVIKMWGKALSKGMVTSLKMITPGGGTVHLTWSECDLSKDSS